MFSRTRDTGQSVHARPPMGASAGKDPDSGASSVSARAN